MGAGIVWAYLKQRLDDNRYANGSLAMGDVGLVLD